MHSAAGDVGSERYEVLRVEGRSARLIEQGTNFRHLINSNSRNHEANDMLVISTDPILSSGIGIVANLCNSLLDKRMKLRRIGNQIEQPGNGRAIIGLHHGSENKDVPRSTHFMGLSPARVKSTGTMRRIGFPHTG